MSLTEAAAKHPSLVTQPDGSVQLNKRHSWHSQIQGTLGVLGLPYCDFVYCTKEDMLVERISFDKDLWVNMVEKLEKFYKSTVLPEIVYPTLMYGNEPIVLE